MEIQSLQAEYESIGEERSKTATELVFVEVISYNKKNLERELRKESRQQSIHRIDYRQQDKEKQRGRNKSGLMERWKYPFLETANVTLSMVFALAFETRSFWELIHKIGLYNHTIFGFGDFQIHI